jgi:hypothetical protein
VRYQYRRVLYYEYPLRYSRRSHVLGIYQADRIIPAGVTSQGVAVGVYGAGCCEGAYIGKVGGEGGN